MFRTFDVWDLQPSDADDEYFSGRPYRMIFSPGRTTLHFAALPRTVSPSPQPSAAPIPDGSRPRQSAVRRTTFDAQRREISEQPFGLVGEAPVDRGYSAAQRPVTEATEDPDADTMEACRIWFEADEVEEVQTSAARDDDDDGDDEDDEDGFSVDEADDGEDDDRYDDDGEDDGGEDDEWDEYESDDPDLYAASSAPVEEESPVNVGVPEDWVSKLKEEEERRDRAATEWSERLQQEARDTAEAWAKEWAKNSQNG